MRISDWSSDVCSSDLLTREGERVRMVCFSFGAVIGSVASGLLGDRVSSFTGVGAAGFGKRGRVTEDMIRITPDDRKSGVSGKRVSVRVDLGGRRIIKKKKTPKKTKTRKHYSTT